MKILYLGAFLLSWSPNYVQIMGLYRNNVDIKVYHYPFHESSSPFGIFRRFRSCLMDIRLKGEIEECDVAILGYPAIFDVPVVSFLRKNGTKVFYNQTLSEYETIVEDRRLYREWGFQAKYLKVLDKIPNYFSINSIFDTTEHKKYFIEKFDYKSHMLHVIPVGADEKRFNPQNYRRDKDSRDCDKLTILYYGTYIPLHGIENILYAAKLLEKRYPSVCFIMIGSGQTFSLAQKITKELNIANVIFKPYVPLMRLIKMISEADICLGIFGKTEKAKRVVAQKIFQCAAMGKPIVTMDSLAMREYFQNETECIMTSTHPLSIAKGIEFLIKNPEQRKQIGSASRSVFEKKYSSKSIGRKLLRLFQKEEN